jgi:hypothetical protein
VPAFSLNEGPAGDETNRSTSNQRNSQVENKINTHSSLKDKRKLKLKLIFSYLNFFHEFIANHYRLPLVSIGSPYEWWV